MDELQLAEYHLKKDALTPDKEVEEMYGDRDSQAYGYDRYRTESMYDSLDRLDMSLHNLMDRRNDQTGRLRQREADGDSRWAYNRERDWASIYQFSSKEKQGQIKRI